MKGEYFVCYLDDSNGQLITKHFDSFAEAFDESRRHMFWTPFTWGDTETFIEPDLIGAACPL